MGTPVLGKINGNELELRKNLIFHGDSKLLEKISQGKIKIIDFVKPFLLKGRNEMLIGPILDIADLTLNASVTISIQPMLPDYFPKISFFKICQIKFDNNQKLVFEFIPSKTIYKDDQPIVEALINHFSVVCVFLNWEEMQETIGSIPSLLTNKLQRVLDIAFCPSGLHSENEIINCLPSSIYSAMLKQDLVWMQTPNNLPNHLRLINPLSLACVRLYTDNFAYELNSELRNIHSYSIWLSYVKKLIPYLNAVIWGLKSLEYFWGTVYRGISVQSENLKPGQYIRFNEFLSTSSKQESCFTSSNGTLYIIKSKTGRSVQNISHFPTENEVLFHPGTTFFVKNINGNQIKLKEILLPYGDKKIFWIDDIPMNNKSIMEDQERKGVSVFWRKNTSSATSLLIKEQTLLLKNCINYCKVITDMNRKEKNLLNSNAGAEFIKVMRDKGYNNKIFIFTSDEQKALNKCKDLGLDTANIKVITQTNELLKDLFH